MLQKLRSLQPRQAERTGFMSYWSQCADLNSNNGTIFVGTNRFLLCIRTEQAGFGWSQYDLSFHIQARPSSWRVIRDNGQINQTSHDPFGWWSVPLGGTILHAVCHNSKAITSLPDDPDDKFALSSADCLLGRPLITVPGPIVPIFQVIDSAVASLHPLGLLTGLAWQHYSSQVLSPDVTSGLMLMAILYSAVHIRTGCILALFLLTLNKAGRWRHSISRWSIWFKGVPSGKTYICLWRRKPGTWKNYFVWHNQLNNSESIINAVFI